jgi:hypothetical protein
LETYATNCFDDSPLFVVTWYPLAIGTVTLAGYLSGRWLLRWQCSDRRPVWLANR